MGRYREVHSEKEAKRSARRYAVTVWWFLWAICLIILAYTAFMHVSEYLRIKDANSVVATYTSGEGFEHALYMDADKHYHSYDITGMGAEHDGDSIVLYYKDNLDLAEPKVGLATWIRSYVIFGIAIILLSIMLIAIYRSDHGIYDVDKFYEGDNKTFAGQIKKYFGI